MSDTKKKMEWVPVRRSNARTLTFIPKLFKSNVKYPPFKKDDPFIHPEILKNTCSIPVLASSKESIPSFLVGNADVDDAIDFSEEDWNEITQSQLKWENQELEKELQETETKELEKKKIKEEEAENSHVKQTLDRKVDKVFERHYHFIKKTCPVMIPYKSSLNHEEHKAYLRAFVKFRYRSPVTATEALEYENYLRLQNRVYEEQQCFMRFAYQVARLQLKTYNDVPEVISNYINDYVKDHCKQVSRYKQLYTQEQSIPICPSDPDNRYSDLYFNHVGHLLSIGNVPKIRLPNTHFLCQVPIDDGVKKKKVVILPNEEGKYLHKTPVSEDPNAMYLAKKYDANIVVSASALKVITDNPGPNYDKEWDIPVVVRSHSITDSDGNEKQQRTVFIDKPMPKKIWTPSEKKQLFFKKSALASMTEIVGLQFFRMKCPLQFKVEKVEPEVLENAKDEKHAAEYTEDFLDLYSSTDHDVFGVSSPVVTFDNEAKSSKKRKLETEVPTVNKGSDKVTSDSENNASSGSNKTVNSDGKSNGENKAVKDKPFSASESKDTPSMLDDLLNLQDTLHNQSANDSPLKQSCDDNVPKTRKLWPWSDSLKTDWDDHIEAKNCKSFSGVNFHYQLFSMGFNNAKPFCSTQPLRVIVRHSLHGLSYYKARKRQAKAYILHAKPEFQVYFGCEVNTISEITQQWIDLLLRPNTTLLEVRVCQATGDIMLSEEKSLAMVLKEGKQQHINFSPQQPLSSMYAVFNAVSALPTGDYILHHDIKTEAFIKLLKATDVPKEMSVQTFDFHAAYSSASVYTRTHAKPPWIALDTHKLTAFHLKHYKIPGTFPMDNPTRKLTKREKKRIKEKAQSKKRLDVDASGTE